MILGSSSLSLSSSSGAGTDKDVAALGVARKLLGLYGVGGGGKGEGGEGVDPQNNRRISKGGEGKFLFQLFIQHQFGGER